MGPGRTETFVNKEEKKDTLGTVCDYLQQTAEAALQGTKKLRAVMTQNQGYRPWNSKKQTGQRDSTRDWERGMEVCRGEAIGEKHGGKDVIVINKRPTVESKRRKRHQVNSTKDRARRWWEQCEAEGPMEMTGGRGDAKRLRQLRTQS